MMSPPVARRLQKAGGGRGKRITASGKPEGEERREIIKILTEFTNVIRPLAPDILQSYGISKKKKKKNGIPLQMVSADIDFIRAKALFVRKSKSRRGKPGSSRSWRISDKWIGHVPCIRSYSCLYRNRASR